MTHDFKVDFLLLNSYWNNSKNGSRVYSIFLVKKSRIDFKNNLSYSLSLLLLPLSFLPPLLLTLIRCQSLLLTIPLLTSLRDTGQDTIERTERGRKRENKVIEEKKQRTLIESKNRKWERRREFREKKKIMVMVRVILR